GNVPFDNCDWAIIRVRDGNDIQAGKAGAPKDFIPAALIVRIGYVHVNGDSRFGIDSGCDLYFNVLIPRGVIHGVENGVGIKGDVFVREYTFKARVAHAAELTRLIGDNEMLFPTRPCKKRAADL